jgi:hypothetical protein
MSNNARAAASSKYPRWFANGVTDHKAWAKRILEREKLGDRELTQVQVAFAKEALDGKAA